MSGTVKTYVPHAGAERIFISFAFIKRSLKRVFRIAAITAAIFILAITLAVMADTRSGGALFGCGTLQPGDYNVKKLQADQE